IADLDEYVLGNLKDGEEALQFDDENVTNILMIGTDNRGSSSRHCRSDSMIILSVNRRTKKIILTSVMRDIYANIPGAGNTRINAAYAYGGPNLLIRTIEKNFKIHLDKYVQVDFYSFMDIVDAVGGVEMNVSAAEIRVMNTIYIPELNEHLGLPKNLDKIDVNKAGIMKLNGKQAVAYSRVRYVGNGDFGRTERQRKVLNEIFKTAKGMSVSELNQFANVALPCITTNLTKGEVLSMLMQTPEFLEYDMVSARMPIDGSFKYMTVRKMSVLGVDFSKNTKYWYKTVYGEES
ncbi:MAG: LCP family protein, partial [Clostridia bacterium]|nr:LCP family protein [Clostridia bacterium]